MIYFSKQALNNMVNNEHQNVIVLKDKKPLWRNDLEKVLGNYEAMAISRKRIIGQREKLRREVSRLKRYEKLHETNIHLQNENNSLYTSLKRLNAEMSRKDKTIGKLQLEIMRLKGMI